MKILVFCFSLFMFLTPPAYAEDNIPLHFGLSAGLGYIAENVIHDKVNTDSSRILYGTMLGSVPGLIKELSDDDFSGGDMTANVAGALVGSYFANRLNRNLTATIEKNKDAYMVGFVYRD